MTKRTRKNKIRDYRRLFNWTQSELAKAVGTRQQYMRRYERAIHKVPQYLKARIASVLGLPEEVIFA